MSELFEKIKKITERVIELNKNLNERNNTLVQDVSQTIHDVLHDTSDATLELKMLQDKTKKPDDSMLKK